MRILRKRNMKTLIIKGLYVKVTKNPLQIILMWQCRNTRVAVVSLIYNLAECVTEELKNSPNNLNNLVVRTRFNLLKMWKTILQQDKASMKVGVNVFLYNAVFRLPPNWINRLVWIEYCVGASHVNSLVLLWYHIHDCQKCQHDSKLNYLVFWNNSFTFIRLKFFVEMDATLENKSKYNNEVELWLKMVDSMAHVITASTSLIRLIHGNPESPSLKQLKREHSSRFLGNFF